MALAVLALASLRLRRRPRRPERRRFFSGATSLFGGSTKMAIAPIIGTPPQVAQELTDALVTAGKERSLTLLPGGGKANYTLRGYLVASSEKSRARRSPISGTSTTRRARAWRGSPAKRSIAGRVRRRSLERRR